jgi:hypothetical protein
MTLLLIAKDFVGLSNGLEFGFRLGSLLLGNLVRVVLESKLSRVRVS